MEELQLHLLLLSASRVSSIEHDSRYKRTWGVGGADGDSEASRSKVVSRQPSGVHNGRTLQVNAEGPSGPYVKRSVLGLDPFKIPRQNKSKRPLQNKSICLRLQDNQRRPRG